MSTNRSIDLSTYLSNDRRHICFYKSMSTNRSIDLSTYQSIDGSINQSIACLRTAAADQSSAFLYLHIHVYPSIDGSINQSIACLRTAAAADPAANPSGCCELAPHSCMQRAKAAGAVDESASRAPSQLLYM